ncbi:unnamed protein product [Brachionus calyciflorus]|uniref:CLEC16A/TT9 C-terminal domain-containing protein n=1 Tax=Brachionus calyciflorus TaxID=104777 RepID=A0A813TT72_9BILA|nr:unnamed protein product [Brachionus calyciflorus]
MFLLFIDFKKAFDTVELLMRKLFHCGFDNKALSFIRNYFTNRKQFVKLGKHFSKFMKIILGVPQENIKCKLFADDTTIYHCGECLDQLIIEFNELLSPFFRWCEFNRLDIDWSKTKCMVVTNKRVKIPSTVTIADSSDLIACTVNLKDKRDRRFLVIDPIQFILVEPEVKRIGWGIVKFSDLIQDVEVTPDKEDSRSLNITIKKSSLTTKPNIVLNSTFTFDDHIRCMAAKQHLVRARDRARRMKLEKIAQLLDFSTSNNTNNSQNAQKPPFMHSHSQNDILPYNLVTGYNLMNTFGHPGRASMISSTWSQITQSDKPSQLSNSPMAAFSKTSSPVNQNLHSTSSTGVSFYKNQVSFTSPSIVGSTNSTTSIDLSKYVQKTESSGTQSPKNSSDSGVQIIQNESDDFLLNKFKEIAKPPSDIPIVNLNDESLNNIIGNTSNSDDPSIQHY